MISALKLVRILAILLLLGGLFFLTAKSVLQRSKHIDKYALGLGLCAPGDHDELLWPDVRDAGLAIGTVSF